MLKMSYRILILLPALLLALYLVFGILSSCYLRVTNPLHGTLPDTRTIYLTFDDGIDPIHTPVLLEVLKRHDVKASFFVLASTADLYPSILHRMKEDGHLIGLHSFNHRNQILQLPHDLRRDFAKSVEVFDKLGIDITFYRPPWGHARAYGMHLSKEYHLKTVLWTVIIGDWKKNATVEGLCHKLQKQVDGSAVICLHDGRGRDFAPLRTIQTVEKMIPKWKEEGYVFETVSELF